MAARGLAATEYENYKPKWEQKEEQEAVIILLRLPEFSKEQLRVTYVNSLRIIRVMGERHLANNKWSRFNQTFSVPQNCLVDKIHGGFKNGILTITMPKKTGTKNVIPKGQEQQQQPKSQEASTSTTTATPPAKEKPREDKEDKVSPSKAAKEIKQQNLEGSPKPVKSVTEDSQSKSEGLKALPKISEITHVAPTQAFKEKPREDKTLPPMSIEEPKGEEFLKTSRERISNIEGKRLDDTTKSKDQEDVAPPKIKRIVPLGPLRKAEDIVKGNILQKTKVSEKEKNVQTTKLDEEEEKAKSEYKNIEQTTPKMESEKKNSGINSNSVKRKAMEIKDVAGVAMKKIIREDKSEERQLMVNMGVAVLVIFALGAYISYTFRSSSSPNTQD